MKKKNEAVHGIYDYSDTDARQRTVKTLLSNAGKNKNPVNAYWRKMR